MIRRDAHRSMNSLNAIRALDMKMSPSGYPEIARTISVPNALIPFDKAVHSKQTKAWVHFFIEDYQFERVWQKPSSYVNILSKYRGVIAPDFSVYYDMPKPMKLWNMYRNRFLANYMQSLGIDVIPNIQILEQELWEHSIEGIEPKGTIAVNCTGTKRRYFARQMLKRQMEYVIEKLHPQTIICYGNESMFPQYENIIHFENNHIKRVRDVQRSKNAK